jgi:acyl-coenzyme A thioesterase PaaI-like protein
MAGSWTPLDDVGEFIEIAGPVFVSSEGLDPGEPARYGLRIMRHHCNGLGNCHGGMLATFLDLAMACGLYAAGGVDRNLPTITMTLDYLAPAPLGDWIESRVAIVHRTPRMAFVQATLYGPGGPVIRGNAVFRIRPRIPS